MVKKGACLQRIEGPAPARVLQADHVLPSVLLHHRGAVLGDREEDDGELPRAARQGVPASFEQPQDGTTRGAKIGTCASIALESTHKAKLSKEE